MRTVGIDLAADPMNTGLCTVDWLAGEIDIASRPVTDDGIVAAIHRAELAGVDVPFGWPDAFVDAVGAHRERRPWPPAGEASEPPADRIPLRYRLTDVATRASGHQPLSVSTDRIGVATLRWARIEHHLRSAGVPIDRSGTSGRVAETYPAGALRAWGLISSGYKRGPNAGVCAALVGTIVERCGPLGRTAERALHRAKDHDVDAFVCAVIAKACRLGLTTRPTSAQLPVARREGWIHVPTAPLEAVVAG